VVRYSISAHFAVQNVTPAGRIAWHKLVRLWPSCLGGFCDKL